MTGTFEEAVEIGKKMMQQGEEHWFSNEMFD